MSHAPVIETARFRLRAAEPRDFEAYAAMWADYRTTRFVGGKPRTRQDSWNRFGVINGLWTLIGHSYWVFAERASDELIGCGGFARWERGIPELEGVPEAGWVLAPHAWGVGAALECMAAACNWADRTLAAPETRAIIDPGNAASMRVAERLGYRQIGDVAFGEGTTTLWSRARGGHGTTDDPTPTLR